MNLKLIIRKLHSLLNFIEDPKSYKLRKLGGDTGLYYSLNKSWFHNLNILTVLDIGANKGQFSLAGRMLLPNAHIYSFEPLPDCFQEIENKFKNSQNFTAFNVGLGDCSGELEFEQNDFSPSSSFLKVSQRHQELFPFTKNTQPITVKIERLDDFIDKNNLEIQTPFLIKIDVQGYEDKVLLGAKKTLQRASLIILETSFEELYERQPLFKDLYTQLIDLGFTYGGSLGQMYDSNTGKIIQDNSIFFKD
jgi:FkbM family methyltransferase